jgi:hypothetical protein
MILAWARLIAHGVGVAAIAVAAQLGIGNALGIVRWDAAFDNGSTAAWRALLTWVAFVYAVAVVAGALVGRRAVRRPNRADRLSARIAATLAAALGATAAIAVAWLPARGVRAPLGVNPGLVVTITAVAGIVAGVAIALIVLSSSPIAGGFRATVAWVWLLGTGSAAAGLAASEPLPAPRLAMLDAPGLVPAQWWSGPALMVMIAAAVGLGVAGYARWAGAHKLGAAMCGGVGPVVVAAAYLVGGPGGGSAQLAPYQASLAATGAGLVASILVALPRFGRAPASAPSPTTVASTPAAAPMSPPADGSPSASDPSASDPSLDPAPSAAAASPAPAYEPAAAPRPAFSSVPVTVSASTSAGGTVYASESRPSIGRPPRGYEEYSDWLKELGGGADPRANGDS